MTLKNTENSAIIKIRNTQSAEDTEETVELITEGKFYKSGDKLYIFYTEEDEGEKTTVMLIAAEDSVTLSRKGSYASKMFYRPGEDTQVVYHTPYGVMTMRLKTLCVENHLDEGGGTLRLLYRLSVNGDEINNDLTLTVKTERDE